MAVREALGFHVPWSVQEPLHEALSATEGGSGLTDGGFEKFRDGIAFAHHLDTASTATEGRLDRDREAVLVREGEHLIRGVHGIGGARNLRGIDLLGNVAGSHLVAELGYGRRGRPDPRHAGIDHGHGEVRVLREEAIPGVNGVGPGAGGGVENLVDHEVRIGGRGAAQGVGLVRHAHMHGVSIGIRVDGHGGDAFVACGADDAYRDFTAVGHQNLGHGAHVSGGLLLRGGDCHVNSSLSILSSRLVPRTGDHLSEGPGAG